jgi:dTDP-3-amino-3,4,6-trideoxy-alpha-D-glucose transaminase
MGGVTVKMNDFARQWRDTGESVEAAVRRVGSSGWYILGPEVAAFERALAALQGRQAAVGCASGQDALELALRALGIQPGDRVLTTPLSAFASTLAVLRCGGVPVFVDTDEHGLLDLGKAEAALAEDESIRFLLPVHLYGHPLDLDRLAALRSRFDLRIVEDCAQALGATWNGQPVGSVGQASAVSFYPTKNLGALGDGGAVLTDDATVEKQLRALRDYGQTSKYVHDIVGLNSRLDELHAGILQTAFLPLFSQWTERRRAIAHFYRSHIDRVRMVGRDAGGSVWHLFPVRVTADQRPQFRRHLQEAGIQTAEHYPLVIPEQPAMRGVKWEKRGEIAQAAQLAAEEVSLPIHPYLTDAEAAEVATAVNAWRAP